MYELDRKRQETMASIKRYTTNANYNIYSMDVLYDYSLENVINKGFTDDDTLKKAIFEDALNSSENMDLFWPGFVCTAFRISADQNQQIRMGSNYDFKDNTSAMLVHCPATKSRCGSVAFAALSHIGINANPETNLQCLVAPYICLDGINDRGVSIAVLTLDSEPVHQNIAGKKNLSTTLAIRYVLDNAISAMDAVKRLEKYNMIASGRRDYHYFIMDASGDTHIVEYDCDDSDRKLVDIRLSGTRPEAEVTTNFFISHTAAALGVNPPWKYGHGQDRYVKAERILTAWYRDQNKKNVDGKAWEILKETAQQPEEGSVTSNTQWSIVYNNTAAKSTSPKENTLEFAFRRNFGDVWTYNLTTNLFRRKSY